MLTDLFYHLTHHYSDIYSSLIVKVLLCPSLSSAEDGCVVHVTRSKYLLVETARTAEEKDLREHLFRFSMETGFAQVAKLIILLPGFSVSNAEMQKLIHCLSLSQSKRYLISLAMSSLYTIM